MIVIYLHPLHPVPDNDMLDNTAGAVRLFPRIMPSCAQPIDIRKVFWSLVFISLENIQSI